MIKFNQVGIHHKKTFVLIRAKLPDITIGGIARSPHLLIRISFDCELMYADLPMCDRYFTLCSSREANAVTSNTAQQEVFVSKRQISDVKFTFCYVRSSVYKLFYYQSIDFLCMLLITRTCNCFVRAIIEFTLEQKSGF